MTIQGVFQKAGERIVVRIIGNNVLFIDPQTNMMSPIEGLNFNKEGTIKEYPDLKDDKDWKQKAIQRFVDKIKSFEIEDKKMDYMINELKQMGYEGLYKTKSGFRSEKI